ncbi:MAG: ATP-dependent helicase HrpB [Pseudomonadota bacterium]
MRSPLPIDDALPALLDALRDHGQAVLEAPPGAGKTTRVPLAIRDAGLGAGRILMLEPRRIAARAAAERMAQTLGERVGATVGYRVRGEAKVSNTTRIEVVTEGILTRMLQSDPSLEGVGTVIFDEFHERSLNADLGLALCLEVREALRDDLQIVVMSATLDGAAVADLMGGAPVVRSPGRAFDVDLRWLERPVPKERRFEAAVAELVGRAVAERDGGLLVFLPGEGEIRRVMGLLDLPAGCVVRPLYGAMPFAEQRAAIAPANEGRKIVLATAIAETSLTIEDVRVVVDGGRARRARFDPGSGMSRLVTEPVSRAEATQRAGRAGRVATGTCYRLWTKGDEGALPAYAPAEIEVADLAGLALELAVWGAREPSDLRFLSPPAAGPFASAQELLRALGALSQDGAVTDHGRAIAGLPLHPRLAHMLLQAGRVGAPLAALLADRDPLRDGSADLTRRLAVLRGGPVPAAAKASVARIRDEAKRLARMVPEAPELSDAQRAALAYPDRVALRRPGDAPRWVLSGGKGARMAEDDVLAGVRLLVITDTDGHPREALIRQAIAIGEAELRAVMGDQIGWHEVCEWSRREGRVVARRQEKLGAVVLDDRMWRDVPDAAVADAMLEGVRQLGLSPTPAAQRFRARVSLARTVDGGLPDVSDAALMARLEDWLLPHLMGVRSTADWRAFDLLPAFQALLSWDQSQTVDAIAPPHFATPLGRKVPVDYGGDVPTIEVRLQELFGVTRHPTAGGVPLRISLLSPAGRPVQVTTDLPGFWVSSYADVRKDMRGRYPKHPWPEDPTVAEPTLRAKRRPR